MCVDMPDFAVGFTELGQASLSVLVCCKKQTLVNQGNILTILGSKYSHVVKEFKVEVDILMALI